MIRRAAPATWRRRAGVALATIGAVLMLGSGAGGVASAAAKPSTGLHASLGNATFPGRALVLSAPPGVALSAARVHIVENGRPVSGAVVTPLDDARAGDFGVVVAIDVSDSMAGRSIRKAFAAARAIAAQRTGRQLFGLILFAKKARVALRLTTDPSAIQHVLDAPPQLMGGTSIYDAMALAVQQLQDAHVTAGSVILLSDGGDNASTIRESAVAAMARADHISFDTVGIRSSEFNPRSLSALARDGGGHFQTADAGQLPRVFTSLLSGLLDRYAVHYLSNAPRGQRIRASVSVDGVPGAVDVYYTSPANASRIFASRSKPKSFWVSGLGLVTVSFGAALLIALGLIAILAPRRRSALRRRVGEFTSEVPDAGSELLGAPAAPRFVALERWLARMSWWPRFKEDVEIAGFTRPAAELVAIDAAGTAGLAVLVGAAVGTPALSLLMVPLGPLALRSLVRHRLRKQRQLFADQLAPHLEELASTMRAGHGLVSGLAEMVRSAAEPSRGEWGRVLADERFGMALDAAMRALARRMDCSDVEQVALVASLHHRTGGNMAEVLDRVAEGVRERADLRRELNALSAQARLSSWVITALPPGLIGVMLVVNPQYMRPLFHGTGIVMVAIAVVLVIAGSLVMRALTEIKV